MIPEHIYPFRDWCAAQHAKRNHMYDVYLPYQHHLQMTAHVAEQYISLCDEVEFEVAWAGCWAHDLIDDRIVSYGEIIKEGNAYFIKKKITQVAEIAYALANPKGRNREERNPLSHYNEIRNTPGAMFVKLCDRIANIRYSDMVGSKMYETYKQENTSFLSKMGLLDKGRYLPMVDHILILLHEMEPSNAKISY